MGEGAGAGFAGDPAQALLRIRDQQGRLCGLGFVADRVGTVVTAHEAVAGLPRLVLHTPGGQSRVLGPESVDLLPDRGLALLRTAAVGGVPGPPLPIGRGRVTGPVAALHQRWEDGAPALTRGGPLGRESGRCGDGAQVRTVPGVLLLDLPVAPLAGAPVLDPGTGAVLAVVSPRVRAVPGPGVAAVPLAADTAPPADTPLDRLLARNAADAPAYGRALNLGGALRLTEAQLEGAAAGPGRIAELAADRVDRPDGLSGEEPQDVLTVLLGGSGSGRTTELAALAVRRAGAAQPLPTLWLRGADLAPGDRTLGDPLRRRLAAAARQLGVPEVEPGELAALCAAAGRPLLVILDGPEEAPLALSARWLAAGLDWLRTHRARALAACRPDGWEQLGPWRAAARALWLGPLTADAAARAGRRYGLPAGFLGPADRGHPLALRLAGELRGAGVHGPVGSRAELFDGWLDLACLTVARRVALTPGGPRRHRRGAPPAPGEDARQVRRLAAVAAGRLHEAARLMLGAGDGALPAGEFARLFPDQGGWARAVREERLLVPAGAGHRAGHEEWGEWLQSLHLDLDAALRLVLEEDGAERAAEAAGGEGDAGGPGGGQGAGGDGRGAGETGCDGTPGAPADGSGPGPAVPRAPDGARGEALDGLLGGAGAGAGSGVGRCRAGVVAGALRRAGEGRGVAVLDGWLRRALAALERSERGGEADWWAGRLLAEGIAGSPEPSAHRELLERLADRAGRDERFGAAFWAGLPLPVAERAALLGRLADGPGRAEVVRAAAAELLAADPRGVLPLLCAWYEEGPAAADLADELLYEHRALALDELTEALVAAAHPRADALLGRLAEREPSALCRAVDRWSHDPRPERHVAAAVHALRTAPHAGGSGAQLLRLAARTLLAREDEPALHGAALALLVRDPQGRAEHLAAALAAYRAGDPFLTAHVLADLVAEHPAQVLAAVRERLRLPGARSAEDLRVLDGAADPAVARSGVLLAAELLRGGPEPAAEVARHLDRLLDAGRDGRPLLDAVLAAGPPVRAVFVPVLAAPGGGREELLDALLAAERDERVLAAVVEALAARHAGHPERRVRELLRLVAERWPGADAVLVRCAGRWAGFARLLASWPEDGPPPPQGPRLARMRALTASGRDPQYAAAEAERQVDRPGGRLTGHTEGLPVPGQGRSHGTL
ncbi:serine protease [Kitasatospora phosalacinea]|uniref:serine protease n=1 Tax=Kitasatospora phosalacinea TaxID=2065 RepID=UPI00068A0A13|nr:serine protease [Kitasatospora phosalacinea]